jgi:hypothetical protein
MSEQIIIEPLKVEVTVHGQQAVLHMSEPREYLAFFGAEPLMLGARLLVAGVEARPDMASAGIAAAMGVIDGIYELRGDIKPAGGAVKHELIERHRRKLTDRVALMLNSKREDKTTPNRGLAKQLVEEMLKEVFK